MRFLLKGFREGLGRLIVFLSWVFSPKKIKRTVEAQAQVNKDCEGLKLYQFYACPFCIKVRRHLHKLDLPIQIRDAQAGQFRDELLADGGQIKVPCLKIEQDSIIWLYESRDIIAYLDERFG